VTELIHNIALAILAAWLFGVAAQFARQPLILAYLVAGFVLGPSGFGFIRSMQSITTISELGLIFLLFMIGLEIDLKKIIRAGGVILGTGAVQIFAGCVLGVVFFRLLGLPMGTGGRWDALYLGVAAALSSTVIIVKVLYEKHELDTLTGRITLGVLVLQDLFAILFLAIQPSLENLHVTVILLSIVRVVGLVATAFIVSRYILPHIFHRIARMPELVLVGALAWCFFVAEVAVYLDLSREMGALIAGVALSTFPYALDVTAKVTSLRDFFITLFFVGLGMTIPIPTVAVLGLVAILAVFTVISRLVTTFLPLYLMRQGLRASILPAISLCQLSEFSLVLLQLGMLDRQVSENTANAASLAFAVLAVLSTFVVIHSEAITQRTITGLKRLGVRDLDQRAVAEQQDAGQQAHGSPIMFLGFHRAASSLIAEFERQKTTHRHQFSVVDFNPLVHETLSAVGARVRYGDVSHRESLVHAGIADAKIVISSVPDALLKGTTNERLAREVRAINPTAKIIVTAEVLDDVQRLYEAGADYVVIARLNVAGELLDAIKASEAGLLKDKRAALDARLAKRGEVLP
jgi:Kef-type K+ transport system membrane component KefB